MTPAQASELTDVGLIACLGYFNEQITTLKQKEQEMNAQCALLIAEYTTRHWERKINEVFDSSK
jgi:hypothetical protein